MAINFTKNMEQYTTAQKNSRAKKFMEFTSKKQLQDAGVLNEEELKFVTSIKGTFNFALHNDGRYMAVTLYRANADKKYNFLVLDLQEQAVAEVGSIKVAKAEILEIVEQASKPAEQEEPAEESVEPAETTEEPAESAAEEEEAPKKSRKSKKNQTA